MVVVLEWEFVFHVDVAGRESENGVDMAGVADYFVLLLLPLQTVLRRRMAVAVFLIFVLLWWQRCAASKFIFVHF